MRTQRVRDKNAVIYGGGGSLGSTFARQHVRPWPRERRPLGTTG